MNASKTLLTCITALILAAGAAANAEPILTTPGGILDTLYGLANVSELPGDQDQLWQNTQGGLTVTARGTWAGYDQDFGILPGVSGGTFQSLFNVSEDGYLTHPTVSVSLAETGSVFRFADDPSGAAMWSSQPADNSDGKDHMRTFAITGGCSAGHYVICWEDLPCLGDADYQDLLVEVGGLGSPVPEPTSLALIALGGVAALLRRRQA